MTISALNNSADYVSSLQEDSNPSLSAPSMQMGQADFLRLLTTQLQNQDPSKPMDPTQFVTDLTQMSQLEATNKMNESIIAMTNSFQNLQTMQATSLIGQNVVVNGDEFSHTNAQPSTIRLNSDQPLTDVKLVISSDSGFVKEINVGDLTGEDTVSWDGLDRDGQAVASGVYQLTAYGEDENGDLTTVQSIVSDQRGEMTLTLATGERISMDDVREIGA
jgi:flagellar basal-body rod modification protein FlgD